MIILCLLHKFTINLLISFNFRQKTDIHTGNQFYDSMQPAQNMVLTC